jgi:predicted aspartyl protease
MKNIKIKFKIGKTFHVYIKGKLNEKKAIFLIDTGASNSCISTSKIKDYKLELEKTSTSASGAGATNMDAQISKNNFLQFGKLKIKKCDLVVFDMQHIDTALEMHNGKPIDGIIGADILIKYQTKIDYSKNKIEFKK